MAVSDSSCRSDSAYLGFEEIEHIPLDSRRIQLALHLPDGPDPLEAGDSGRPTQTKGLDAEAPSLRRTSTIRRLSRRLSRTAAKKQEVAVQTLKCPCVVEPPDSTAERETVEGAASLDVNQSTADFPPSADEALPLILDSASRAAIAKTADADPDRYDQIEFQVRDRLELKWKARIHCGAIEQGHLRVGDLRDHVIRILGIEEPVVMTLWHGDTHLRDTKASLASFQIRSQPSPEIVIGYLDVLFLRLRWKTDGSNLVALNLVHGSIEAGFTVRELLLAAAPACRYDSPAPSRLRFSFRGQTLEDGDATLQELGIGPMSEIEVDRRLLPLTPDQLECSINDERVQLRELEYRISRREELLDRTAVHQRVGRYVAELTDQLGDIMRGDPQGDDVDLQVRRYGKLLANLTTQWSLTAPAGQRSCQVCGTARPVADFPDRTSELCRHAPAATCKECLATWISTQVLETSGAAAVCPDCHAPLTYADMRRHADPATFARYDHLTLRIALDALPDFHWCLNPACGSGQLACPGTRGPLTCSACGHRRCVRHGAPWHEGESCAAHDRRRGGRLRRALPWLGDDEERSERAKRAVARVCPECRTPIQRSEGCASMSCRRCGAYFSWDRARPYGSSSRRVWMEVQVWFRLLVSRRR